MSWMTACKRNAGTTQSRCKWEEKSLKAWIQNKRSVYDKEKKNKGEPSEAREPCKEKDIGAVIDPRENAQAADLVNKNGKRSFQVTTTSDLKVMAPYLRWNPCWMFKLL
ncbi:uncharacterized protein LOC125468544 [Pyrus x bretschneideri]|uniref:uncharacterized protein LOC125468544 n=1 Tax=Pyrus x bretschneideri TaxID=225117 RepID=UPI00202F54EC|nr:uncharacterized protein LOC125468544 [Pyrus x bretschneideri]